MRNLQYEITICQKTIKKFMCGSNFFETEFITNQTLSAVLSKDYISAIL